MEIERKSAGIFLINSKKELLLPLRDYKLQMNFHNQ